MPDQVIERYTETRTETTRRNIVVKREEGGYVEVWHGRRKLQLLGGWTNVKVAIQDCREKAKEFKVDTLSSLRLRVRERVTVRRYRDDGGCRDEPDGPERVVSEGHVFCIHGEIPERSERTFRWELVVPVGFEDRAHDPGDALPSFFRGEDLRIYGERFFYDGFVQGAIECAEPVRRDLRPDEMPPDLAERPTPRTAAVVLSGTWKIGAPVAEDDGAVLARLRKESLDLSVDVDYGRDGSTPLSQRWKIWTGSPATEVKISL